jgi:hypothetical protein
VIRLVEQPLPQDFRYVTQSQYEQPGSSGSAAVESLPGGRTSGRHTRVPQIQQNGAPDGD